MANYEKPARSKYFNDLVYYQMAEDLQLTGNRNAPAVRRSLVGVGNVVQIRNNSSNSLKVFLYDAALCQTAKL